MKDIHDVMTRAKFGDDRLRGSGVVAGQISAFPIYFAGRPYNTLTLPCERCDIDAILVFFASLYITSPLTTYPLNCFVQLSRPILARVVWACAHLCLLVVSPVIGLIVCLLACLIYHTSHLRQIFCIIYYINVNKT